MILLACALAPLKDSLAANPDIVAEITGRYESNASNSDRPSDRLADGFLVAAVGLGRSGVWGRDWRWQAGLASEGKLAFRFFELSEIDAGVRFGLERKFGLGWRAPRLQFDLFPAFRAAGQPGASGFSLVPALSLRLASNGKGRLQYQLRASLVFCPRCFIRFSGAGNGDFRLVRPFPSHTLVHRLFFPIWRRRLLCDTASAGSRRHCAGSRSD